MGIDAGGPLAPGLFTSLAIVVVSLYTLVTAAERAVSGSLALARRYEVPDVLVGMTVLALGTSLPELGSHVVASAGILSGTLDYRVTSAVVVGGSVGSATVQQLLLVGAYLASAVYGYAGRTREVTVPGPTSTAVRRDLLVTVGSLVLVLASASLLLWVVDAVVAALEFGGSMVGVLTIGTAAALPELSTVLDAVRRRTPNVALGVLVGSNLVNPLVGIGLGGVISTYHVPRPVLLWDLPFKLVVAGGLLAYLRLGPDRALTRREGAYLVVLYLVYLSGRLLVFTTG